MPSDWAGKTVLVTGASRGIGKACAVLFAEQGANLILASRSKADLETAATSIAKEDQRILVVPTDVTEPAQVNHLFQKINEEFGALDVLVNNAGTTKFVAHGDFDGLDSDDFKDIYGVNVIGPFQMVRAARQALTASGNAAVVNVASVAGVKGIGSSIAYAASKGALITMTKSLARVLGPEIRVNTVCPGFIEGDWLAQGMGQETYDRTRHMLLSRSPLQVVCTPETVAQSILSFIDSHGVVTGQHLVLDGGQLLL